MLMGHWSILQDGPEMNQAMFCSIVLLKSALIFGIFHRGMFIMVGMIMVVWTIIIICASGLEMHKWFFTLCQSRWKLNLTELLTICILIRTFLKWCFLGLIYNLFYFLEILNFELLSFYISFNWLCLSLK